MRDTVPFTLIAVAIAVVSLAVYAKASVWIECRGDHSWLYCIHLIGN